MSSHNTLDIYIDGASRGNPGRAGIGIVFAHGDAPVKNISKSIGTQTNNVAEYTALIHALEEALSMKVRHVRVFSDSELLCRQLSGVYKVKNESLRSLFMQAVQLRMKFDECSISHIPREQNKGADKLARQATKDSKSKTDKIAARDVSSGEESPSSTGQRSG
jgi:ribonuclease HI